MLRLGSKTASFLALQHFKSLSPGVFAIATTIKRIGCSVLLLGLATVVDAQVSAQDFHTRVPGDSWQRFRRVEDAGFSADRLLEAIHQADTHDIAGMLVVYDGALVLRYGDIETRYMCHSIRKSLMSIMFGMYDIDLNQTLAELAIDDLPKLTDQEKQATIADLLKSRSGVYHRAAYEPNSMKQTRPQRGAHQPGTHWWYNNWDFNALLTIFEKETGEKFFEAFQKMIAEPLQLEDFRLRDGYYHREPSSIHPAYPFRISARDLARIGWLVASQGKWANKQIVPAEWIRESTLPHSTINPWSNYHSYGYLWWIGEQQNETIISALGNGNNSIDIVPGRKLVFVFRANTFKGKNIRMQDRWKIINGILAAQDLPPNPQPELVNVPFQDPMPPELDAVHLSESDLRGFPIELSRHLPPNIPKTIRDQKIQISAAQESENASKLVLYTQKPPALQLDLIPLGSDRFWIEGLNEIGVIWRNELGEPNMFLMKDDLIASLKQAKQSKKQDLVSRIESLLQKHFDYLQFDRDSEIVAGIKKLISLQEDLTKWPYEGNYRVDGKTPFTYEIGGTALVCLALLYGAEENDMRAKKALDDGVSFILDNLGDPRMATSRKIEYDMRVLAQAYSLLLLSHLRNQQPEHQKIQSIEAGIQQLTNTLVAEQMDDGGWNYQGRPMHASFVTASVVQALLWANNKNNPIDQQVLENAADALAFSRFVDGGFRYFGTHESQTVRHRQDLLPGSVGRASICETMLYALGHGSINRIQKSIDAFHLHWQQLENRRQKSGTHEGPYLVAPYYFYYGHRYAAQAIEMLPETRRNSQRDRLYQLLMRTKSTDGTWNDRIYPRSRAYGTAMVMLALMSDRIGAPPRLMPSSPANNSGETQRQDVLIQRPEKYRGIDKVMVKNVYVMFPDKTIKNVTPTPNEGFYGAGCIHPDGKDVVFPGAAWGYSRIWKYTISTGQLNALTPESFASINPSYSPDGKQIVFVADKDLQNPRFDMFEVGRTKPHDTGFRGGISSASNLYVMDADGSNIRRLTSGDHYDTRPSFSPDGKTVVFLSSRGANTLHLWTVPADASAEPVKMELENNPWAGRPRFSVNGKEIFFFTGIDDGRYVPEGRHTLCRVPASGGKWRVVSGDTLGKSSHGPDPDPNGKSLWYHAFVDGRWGIYRLNLDGGKPKHWVPKGFEEANIAHPAKSRNGYISFDSRSFVETVDDQ